jgi:hypothetical protein
MKLLSGLLLIITLVSLSACRGPIITPTPGREPTISPLSATITISPTATLTPSPQVDAPLCLPQRPGISLETGPFGRYPHRILTFLNAGGDPQELDQGLYLAGVANLPVPVAVADMTGDDRQDIVVSIFDPESQQIVPAGVLLIYRCENGAYILEHAQASMDGWSAAGIRYLEDLNGDGRAELVVSSAMCGASTCFEEIQILSWTGEGFENHLEGDTTDLAFPEISLDDADGDGLFMVEVRGSGPGSVGAGPTRSVTRIWMYDDEIGRWMPTEEVMEPSSYRIHVLHDAEDATARGDYVQALMLYGRVIQDPTLEDWVDPDLERDNLAAYAMFKTAIVHLLRRNESFARASFDQLRSTYPVDSLQGAFTELADVFQSAYDQEGLEAGCLAAQEFAAENAEDILRHLGPEQFGYANPEVESSDVCPWN